MPFFHQEGYTTYAVSLRGTSKSPVSTYNDDSKSSIKLEEHMDDLINVISFVQKSSELKPIIVSHSFGGLISQKLLELPSVRQSLSAVALLCSVPPSGNGPMTSRFVKTRFIDSLKIVYGFVFKAVNTNLKLCRELFFDEAVSDSDIQVYMSHFIEDSKVGLDLSSVIKSLPILSANVNQQAAWLEQGTPPRCLVLGGGKDFIVDKAGVEETAFFMNVKPVFVDGLYHDVMLGPKWKSTADILLEFFKR